MVVPVREDMISTEAQVQAQTLPLLGSDPSTCLMVSSGTKLIVICGTPMCFICPFYANPKFGKTFGDFVRIT